MYNKEQRDEIFSQICLLRMLNSEVLKYIEQPEDEKEIRVIHELISHESG